MEKFIKVTKQSNGKVVRLNVKNIAYYSDNTEKALITLKGCTTLAVEESSEQVDNLINKPKVVLTSVEEAIQDSKNTLDKDRFDSTGLLENFAEVKPKTFQECTRTFG